MVSSAAILFNENRIEGAQLLCLNDFDLKSIGIKSSRERNRILTLISQDFVNSQYIYADCISSEEIDR